MIMQGIIVGGMVCVVLIALVGGLHYGTAGHSAPFKLGSWALPTKKKAAVPVRART